MPDFKELFRHRPDRFDPIPDLVVRLVVNDSGFIPVNYRQTRILRFGVITAALYEGFHKLCTT